MNQNQLAELFDQRRIIEEANEADLLNISLFGITAKEIVRLIVSVLICCLFKSGFYILIKLNWKNKQSFQPENLVFTRFSLSLHSNIITHLLQEYL